MTRFVEWLVMAGDGEDRAGTSEGGQSTASGGQGKSACPETCKPLARLTVFRSSRSVAGMQPGFAKAFQGSDMHGAVLRGGEGDHEPRR